MKRAKPALLARHYIDLANEVAHITAMVCCLEQMLSKDDPDCRSTFVTLPEYWRARLDAHANVPPAMQAQVHRLLARLDAIRHGRSPARSAA
jgi:hypothetical protein